MKDPKPRQLSSVPRAKEERVGVAYMSLVCLWHLADIAGASERPLPTQNGRWHNIGWTKLICGLERLALEKAH